MSVCSVLQSCLILCDPMDCTPPVSLSMGFFRQGYRSGLPFPPPGDLPDPGIEFVSPALAGRFFTAEPPGKPTLSTLVRAKPVGFLTLVSCFHAGCFQMMPARLQIPDPPVSSYLLLGQLEIFFHGGPGKDE